MLVPVTFPFVCMTLFAFPPLITLLIIMEFKIKHEVMGLYFDFLDKKIGKGFFMVMMALIVGEQQFVTEIIFAILISFVGAFNVALGTAFYF